MKKILFLFIVICGVTSFANNSNESSTEFIINKNSNLNVFDTVLHQSATYVLDKEYTVKTTFQQYICTATVYYNGVAVESFSVPAVNEAFLGMACQLAYALAQEYIQENS